MGVEPRREAGKGSQDHHSLDAQIQVAHLFTQDAPQGPQQERRAQLNGQLQKQGKLVHFAASFSFRSQVTRYREKNSLPRMNSRMMPWITSPVADGICMEICM